MGAILLQNMYSQWFYSKLVVQAKSLLVCSRTYLMNLEEIFKNLRDWMQMFSAHSKGFGSLKHWNMAQKMLIVKSPPAESYYQFSYLEKIHFVPTSLCITISIENSYHLVCSRICTSVFLFWCMLHLFWVRQ